MQTPTLAIVVEREKDPRLQAHRLLGLGPAGCRAGAYAGRWFDEGFEARGGRAAGEHATAFRLWDKARAEAIQAKCEGQAGGASRKNPSRPPSSRRCSSISPRCSAKPAAASACRPGPPCRGPGPLRKHKVLTYPRTDARALPEDYVGRVKGILGSLPDAYAPFANEIVKHGWVLPNKRIFNNAKISDHFAIIPTGTAPKSLSEAEAKIYDLVTRRFLAVFFPAAEYRITTRITRVEGEAFKTEGKVLVNPGWLAVYGKEGGGERDGGSRNWWPSSPAKVSTDEILVKAAGHQAARRFNEATLLSAMEGAGKMVDDEELRGDGRPRPRHPATRAQIIET